MDEAGSRVRLRRYKKTPKVRELEEQLHCLKNDLKDAVVADDDDRIFELRETIKQLEETIDKKKAEWQARRAKIHSSVKEEDIAQIVSSWTGIPVKRMTLGEGKRLLQMEENAAQARNRPGGSHFRRQPCAAQGARRFAGSKATYWLVHFPGPDGRRENRTVPCAWRSDVRR